MTRPAILDRPWFPAAFVALVAALVGLSAMTPWMVGTYYDDGTYTVLAKSLATGHGYRYLNLPGNPVATHYPWGYPLFLATLWKLWPSFPENTALFKLANVALLAVVAVAMYAFARRVIGWRPALAAFAALVGTVTPAMLVLSSALMSEMLFLALMTPALIMAERLAREPGGWHRPVLLGVLFGVALLVRTIGIPAVPALALVLVLRGRWRDAVLVSATAALVVAPWIWWTRHYDAPLLGALYSSYGSYGAWAGQAIATRGRGFLLEVARVNSLADAMYFGNHFMPVAGKLPAQIALGLLLAALGAGMWRLRRLAPVTILYLLGYATLLLFWAFQPDRFYYSMEPIIGLLLVAAGAWAWELVRDARPPRRAAGVALAVCMAVLAVGDVRDAAAGIRGRRWERAQRERHMALAPVIAWVRSSTRPDAVIGVEADPLVYLYTGRRTHPLVTFRAAYHVDLPSTTSPEFLGDTRQLIDAFRPDYTVARGSARDLQSTILTALRGLPVRSTPVVRFPDGGYALGLRWPAPRPDSLR